MSETQPNKEKKIQARPSGDQKVVQIMPTVEVKPIPGTEVRRDLAKATKNEEK